LVAPTREGLVIASTAGRRSMISSANSVEPMKLQRERRHRGEDGGDSSTSQADSKKRPPGVKASKASGKQTVDQEKQVKEFDRIWTIKQKEIDAKERLTKMSLLDSLIGKKEPLADFSFHRMLLFCLIKFFLVSREWRLGQEQERVERQTRPHEHCITGLVLLHCFGHGSCTLAVFWSRVFVTIYHENACIFSRVFVRLIKCNETSITFF
ncbi:unnamed protein product, partial [Brassica rapa]